MRILSKIRNWIFEQPPEVRIAAERYQPHVSYLPDNDPPEPGSAAWHRREDDYAKQGAEDRRRFLRNHGCEHCLRGRVNTVRWREHAETRPQEHRAMVEALESRGSLRSGQLYQCRHCHLYWYIKSGETLAFAVPDSRIGLVEQWGQGNILLSPDMSEILSKIGRTPRNQYDAGPRVRDTPCAVLTDDGEWIECAIIRFQRDPPTDTSIIQRLATDIAEIHPSRYALPLDIRTASASASEVGYGYAPTDFIMPDRTVYTGNWTLNFFVHDCHPATEARLLETTSAVPKSWWRMHEPSAISYFIADGVRK